MTTLIEPLGIFIAEYSKFFETTLGYFRRLKTIKPFAEKRIPSYE